MDDSDLSTYVHYFPGVCSQLSLTDIYQETKMFFPSNSPSSRRSFIVGESNYLSGDIPQIQWSKVPYITGLRNFLAIVFHAQPDYCLVHLYVDGSASINWHNDKEAWRSDVFSISFGATRKFRFRRIHQKSGYLKELLLHSGDLVWMKPGCQQKFLHCIPKTLSVKEPRINLTFRFQE